MADRWSNNWFPELLRVDDPKEQTALYRAAYRPVVWTARYWALAIVLQGAIQVFARLSVRLIVRWLALPGAMGKWDMAGTAIGGGIGGLVLLWLIREQISKNLRKLLLARGVPICLTCGYDIRGQVEPRCPECGASFAPKILNVSGPLAARGAEGTGASHEHATARSGSD